MSQYTKDDIQVLEMMQAVRLRPHMYIGDTGPRGLHHLYREVLDNSVDEALQGACTDIEVRISDDSRTITVTDNGRGIPVDPHSSNGKSTLEVVLTVLHAGGKFGIGAHGYAEAGGLHGVGVSCVNALSSNLVVTVWRPDPEAGLSGCFRQAFSCGAPVGELERLGDAAKSGTRVEFTPDVTIFGEDNLYDHARIARHLQECACLNPNVSFTLIVGEVVTKFESLGGLPGLLALWAPKNDGQDFGEPIHIEGRSADVTVELAAIFGEGDGEWVISYANNIPTYDGGTHVSGARRAITTVVNASARSKNLIKDNLSGDDIRSGLSMIVAVRLSQPAFEAQTKTRLQTPKVESAVYSVVSAKLTAWFDRYPEFLKKIVERAMAAQKARDVAKKVLDQTKNGVFKNARLPGKLTDCDSSDPSKTELFLVEGDSAAGSAKDGRDPNYQAVLPLRGKLINVIKNSLSAFQSNAEVQALITALGAGADLGGKEGFKIEDCRYGKIIIMTDADVDGSHIATLVLSLIYRLMSPLIAAGRVYLAVPPFYRVMRAGVATYCWTEAEMRTLSAKSGTLVTRYKGLGEMNPEELADTTMNPANRRLIRVTMDDLVEAARVVDMYMGKAVAARKSRLLEEFAGEDEQDA